MRNLLIKVSFISLLLSAITPSNIQAAGTVIRAMTTALRETVIQQVVRVFLEKKGFKKKGGHQASLIYIVGQ